MLIEKKRSIMPSEAKELQARGLIEVGTWTGEWVRTPRTTWPDIESALREIGRETP